MDQWELPLSELPIEPLPSDIPSRTAKDLGAYYTDSQIADFLVAWAVRGPTDSVADPSFGGGVFLRAAAKRLRELGGSLEKSVSGVEVDESVHNIIGRQLRDEFGVNPANFVRDDFFAIPPGGLAVTAIVGNPPFIRFHRFSGKERKLALMRARQSGVTLTRLASSWAPFLVHAVSMVDRGGRMAMVVPAEIGYAAYAAPVLEFLERSFGRVMVLAFRTKLFPTLSEDTYLLLAEGKGGSAAGIDIAEYDSIGHLCRTWPLQSSIVSITAGDLSDRKMRLAEAFVSGDVRRLYHDIAGLEQVVRLGEIADVGIGYVTGANQFFHLSATEAMRRNMPRGYLKRAVFRGKAVAGVVFGEADWLLGTESGDCGYLLHVPPGEVLPRQVAELVEEGESNGIQRGYKCRNRQPWFTVPNVYLPDAVLTYMSGRQPRFALNGAGAFAPNTLHVVRSRDNGKHMVRAAALSWLTSLTQLSAEIEGHALGGGMLKIEPTEAERLLIANPFEPDDNLVSELDRLVRAGDTDAATEHADRALLIDSLGLSKSDCLLMREAVRSLRARRGVK